MDHLYDIALASKMMEERDPTILISKIWKNVNCFGFELVIFIHLLQIMKQFDVFLIDSVDKLTELKRVQ